MFTSGRGKCSVPQNEHYVTTLATKGTFKGVAHKDPHANLQNFLDVYIPFSF